MMSLHALVVSDSAVLATLLQHHFLVLQWSCDAMTVSKVASQDSHSLDYGCVVMVIDGRFRSRYGNVLEEIGHFFKNVARRGPFYLIFEHQYETGFNNWLRGTKRLYQSKNDVSKLQEFVRDIVEAESQESDTGFMRP